MKSYKSTKKGILWLFAFLVGSSLIFGFFGQIPQKNFFPLFSWKLFYNIEKDVSLYSFKVLGVRGEVVELLEKSARESRGRFVMRYKDFQGLVRLKRQVSKKDFRQAVLKFLNTYSVVDEVCGYKLDLVEVDALEFYRTKQLKKSQSSETISEMKCLSNNSEGETRDNN